jgi:hypothetical protein
MNVNLFKISKDQWVVISDIDKQDALTFFTIEDASTCLESIGIYDEEIDKGLIDMTISNTNHIEFNIPQGKYLSTSNSNPGLKT